jgi:hypothetical protein
LAASFAALLAAILAASLFLGRTGVGAEAGAGARSLRESEASEVESRADGGGNDDVVEVVLSDGGAGSTSAEPGQ